MKKLKKSIHRTLSRFHTGLENPCSQLFLWVDWERNRLSLRRWMNHRAHRVSSFLTSCQISDFGKQDFREFEIKTQPCCFASHRLFFVSGWCSKVVRVPRRRSSAVSPPRLCSLTEARSSIWRSYRDRMSSTLSQRDASESPSTGGLTWLKAIWAFWAALGTTSLTKPEEQRRLGSVAEICGSASDVVHLTQRCWSSEVPMIRAVNRHQRLTAHVV